MKAEKTNQEKIARVIQQTHERGSVQFVDNRLSNIAQMLSEQPVQRVGMEEEEDLIQGRFADSVQRTEEEEEEAFQMKTVQLQSNEEEEDLQMKADSAIQKMPNNTGLPDNLKAGVEHLSGFSMDDVRVHYNSDKPATVQALAYTRGTDIHVAPGQEKHLSHEAWHVAQQMAGRVQPTTEVGGMPVNDNVGLEHEADVMGEKAVQMTRDINTKKRVVDSCVNDIVQKQIDDFNTPLQRVWLNDPQLAYYRWDKVINGLIWYYHKSMDLMYFIIQDLSRENVEWKHIEGIPKPYGDWVSMGAQILEEDPSILDLPGEKAFQPFILHGMPQSGKGQFVNKYSASEFQGETNSAVREKGSQGHKPEKGIDIESNIGKYVFHLTSIRNLFSKPHVSQANTGIKDTGLDPRQGGGVGGACETCAVEGDVDLKSSSEENSKNRIAVTSSRDVLQIYINQRWAFTQKKAEELGGDFVTGNEGVLLRIKLKREHIGAMKEDPVHTFPEVRLIEAVPIAPSEIELLTTEGWVHVTAVKNLEEILTSII